jgi:hypothetical protein
MRLSLIFALVLFALVLTFLVADGDVWAWAGVVALLAWVVFLLRSVIITARLLSRKAWLPGFVCLALPFAVPFAAYEVAPYARHPADFAHFETMHRSYDGQIAELPKDGKRYAEFNWGGMLFASRGVVYDETDEIALPSGHQSAAWKSRMKETDLTCGGDGPIGPVEPVGDHYYVTTFGC